MLRAESSENELECSTSQSRFNQVKIAVATGNLHKAEEIAGIVKQAGRNWDVVTASQWGGMPEVDESAPDFAGNARLKAEALRSKIVSKDVWVLSDDIGLCVDVIQGAPGVHTARYAGLGASDAENMTKLLNVLDGIGVADRAAAFVCHLCMLGQDGLCFEAQGEVPGHIAEAARGTQGFGYDPIFIPDGFDETFAELGEETKSNLSHRAHAVRMLLRVVTGQEGQA